MLTEWTKTVSQLQGCCHALLYLSMPKLLQLYRLLHCPSDMDRKERADKVLHEVSFIAANSSTERQKLRATVEVRHWSYTCSYSRAYLTNSLTYSLTHSFTSLTHSPHSLTHQPTQSLTHSPFSLTHSLTHPFTSLTHSPHSPTQSLTHSPHSLTHPPAQSLTSLTYSLTSSLTFLLLYFHTQIQTSLESAMETSDCTDSPMVVVGKFLDMLLQDHTFPQCSASFTHDTLTFSRHRSIRNLYAQPLYSCPTYSHANLLCLILEVFSCIPESYQLLRCHGSTTEEELGLFLKRASTQPSHYLMLDVNKLPFKLQEVCSDAYYIYRILPPYMWLYVIYTLPPYMWLYIIYILPPYMWLYIIYILPPYM